MSSTPQVDFLRNCRQFDEPILSITPYTYSWREYQAWRTWMEDALIGEQVQHDTLRDSTIRACVDSGLPPPAWPLSVLENIERNLLFIQAERFLLCTGADRYLFVDQERKAAEALRA